VISPIGDEDSDIRKHADDFLELLVEPALSKFGFMVIRADKLTRSTIITNDIIELVQQSHLCLVDLTFHNPNVFYECGRRHETGKPTIQLIKKGEKLPFDVAGIRTLEYDLSDPRSTLESVKKVISFIDEIDSTNSYGAQSSGASLTTIAATLARIEKKLSGHEFGKNAIGTLTLSRKDLLTMHPSEAFHKAFEQGDLDAARFVLPRIKKFLGDDQYVVALSVLAEAADDKSKEELISLLPKLTENENSKILRITLSGLTDYYNTTASWAKGITDLSQFVQDYVNNNNYKSTDRAFVLNRLQMLRYQEGEYGEALIDALKVVELAPNDESYWYNLSILYQKLERFEDAANSVIKFFELCKEPKSYHMEHVIEVLTLADRKNELDKILCNRG
jgi:tetratricopeptide (TPR) repeat protein